MKDILKPLMSNLLITGVHRLISFVIWSAFKFVSFVYVAMIPNRPLLIYISMQKTGLSHT